ncbi:MAG TPA: hypothetical protein VGM51_09645 [Armatimonadota bacterium]|jgi:hypothetical protein
MHYTGRHGQQGPTQIEGFNNDLDLSASDEATRLLDAAYALTIPDYIRTDRPVSTHTPNQVDAYVQTFGSTVEVEEKFRPAKINKHTGLPIVYRDLLIEDVQVDADGGYRADGWLWRYPADRLIATAWEATGAVLIVRAGALRDAYEANRDRWFAVSHIACAGNRVQGNVAYYSISTCVDTITILDAVPGAMLIDTRGGRVWANDGNGSHHATTEAIG